jgi:hypothetical protein
MDAGKVITVCAIKKDLYISVKSTVACALSTNSTNLEYLDSGPDT